MSYKLYLDKPEIFECDVSVKNANINNSIARLVVESDNVNLIFKGDIKNNKCTIPIKKLKGLLNESDRGKIHLEIIVENVYFKPWSEEFVVEEHTSVKVQVKEQKEIENKPVLEVKVKSQPKKQLSVPAREIVYLCEIFDIKLENYKKSKRDDFKQIVKEYFKENKEFKNKMNHILNEVTSSLK